MSFDASNETGGASIETGAQAGSSGGGSGVSSIIAGTGVTITSTGPGGTGDVTVNASMTFGGAPPAIASAGAAGSNSTASRSNHTHAFDFPVYAPSLAGMQAAGVVQQTYAAPNATPVTTTFGRNLIAYGDPTSTGLITSNSGVWVISATTTAQLVVAQAAGTASVTPATVTAVAGIQTFGEAISTNWRQNVFGTGVNAQYQVRRARGTFAAQTTLVAGDTLFNFLITGFDGATNVNSFQWGSFIPSDGTVAAGRVDQMFAFTGANGTAANVNAANMVVGGDSQGNAYLGKSALSNVDVNGFAFFPALNGSQPNNPAAQGFGGVRSGNRVATLFNMQADGLRMYAYNTTLGGFLFSQFYNYDPGSNTGRVPFAAATAHQLTDSDTLKMTVTSTHGLLTVGSTTVAHDGAILVNSGVNGQSIGGGGTAGIYVADPNGGGAANVAVDDYFFGQRLVGYTNTNLTDLGVGVGTGHTFSLAYTMDRFGGGATALAMDGTTGAIAIGDVAGGRPVVQVVAATAGPTAGDLMVGYNGLAAADTRGFPYLATVPARPTGAPNAFANATAVAVDLTTASGHALYLRNATGGQWEPIPTFITTAAAGAGAALIANLPAGFGTTAKWWLFKDSTGTPTVIPYYQ